MAAGVAAIALSVIPAVAHAQSTPPTTVEVETSTKEVTVTSLDTKTVDTNDDDSDKTGLWGLLGLLGLAGLAGLKRKKDDDYTRPPTPSNTAPPTSSGASGTGR